MSLEVGQTVGDYEILEAIGSGGMGHVYRVRNVISQRVEAMKALQPAMTAEADFAARFSAEIRTLASFDHPNIAQLRTAFQYEGQQLMVMEFVEGSTLDKLAANRPLPPSEVVAIALQILSALSYAHSRGVIHRDIKPANVMVTAGRAVKLMDFGIAKSATENQLTQPGSTFGSFYYISPEQIRSGPVDARSDVYSVGVVLYEMLSGRRPFQADNTFELLNQHLNEIPQPPVAVNPSVPQPLNDLVLMAMSKDPAQRFRTAEAFAKALRSVSGTETITAPRAPVPQASQPTTGSRSEAAEFSVLGSAAPPKKPNRTIWVLAGALAVVAVFVAALTLAPRFIRTSAGTKPPPHEQPAEVTPAAAPAPGTPINAPASQAATAPPADAPAPATPQTVPAEKAPAASGPEIASKSRVNATAAKRPSSYPSVNEQRAAEVGSASTVPPDTAPPAQDAVAAQPSAPAKPSQEDLEQAQEELLKLNSRASAVAGSVERLQQQQAADGLGLRQDMAGAYARMNTYLHAADADAAEKNLSALQRHIALAEKEISTLERFFSK